MIFSIRANTEVNGIPGVGTEMIFRVGCRTCTESWKALLNNVSSGKLGFIFRFKGRLPDENGSRGGGYYITQKKEIDDKVGEMNYLD